MPAPTEGGTSADASAAELPDVGQGAKAPPGAARHTARKGAPPVRFDALLLLVEEALGPEQLAEIELHVAQDEHEIAFEILCSMLGAGSKPTSANAFAELVSIGHELGADDSVWRDVRRELPT